MNMLRVLVVDDNAGYRKSFCDIVRSRFPSFDILEAENGTEALAVISSSVPDVIFMDVHLQNENGFQLTQRIKAGNAGVTVVMLTNYDLPEYRDAAFLCGASYFLAKSRPVEELWELVEEILALRCSALSH